VSGWLKKIYLHCEELPTIKVHGHLVSGLALTTQVVPNKRTINNKHTTIMKQEAQLSLG